MRMYLLSSDSDTLTGMRLAGVDGELIKSEEQFCQCAEKARLDENIGVLLVTRTLGEEYPQQIINLKKKGGIIVTQIPDMNNPDAAGDSISGYIRDAVGINI